MALERVSELLRGLTRERLKQIAIAAAVVLGGGAILSGLAMTVLVSMRFARIGRDITRFIYGLLTMRLYRRCVDCRRWTRGDARVCWRCGYRKLSRRRWAAR